MRYGYGADADAGTEEEGVAAAGEEAAAAALDTEVAEDGGTVAFDALRCFVVGVPLAFSGALTLGDLVVCGEAWF